MSVKMMTTEQIHTNLATISNMWPGGIPMEQADNVNALKAELKRRGVEFKAVSPSSPAPQSLGDMNADQLAKELQRLSLALGKDPANEELQEQFANVRFEMRTRAKAAPPPPPVAVKEVELSPNNGNGHIAPNFGQGVPSDQQAHDEAQMRMLQAQAARARDIEVQMQLVRKHNMAKIAADVAAGMLRGNQDPNGDDIEKACMIGMQVAQTIYAKVDL